MAEEVVMVAETRVGAEVQEVVQMQEVVVEVAMEMETEMCVPYVSRHERRSYPTSPLGGSYSLELHTETIPLSYTEMMVVSQKRYRVDRCLQGGR